MKNINLSPMTFGALIGFAIIGVFSVINENFDIIGNKKLQEKILEMKLDNRYIQGAIGYMDCSELSVLKNYTKNTQVCKEYDQILKRD